LTDSEVVIDDVAIDSEQEESQERNRRWWGLLAAVLLLLLLMCCVVTAAQVWMTAGPQQARFIARNIECLQCHTELIPDFSKADVHQPFATKDCVTCHTPHGKKVTVTVTQGATTTWKRFTTAIEWLPLKWWFALTEGPATKVGVTSNGKGTSTSRQFKGGASHLVLPEDELCWMCHGDLGVKLTEQYQHQPFEAGRCTNCHNPHASNNRALLTQAPNKLCFTCHPIGMELGREQTHPPAAQGWCVDCHNPHASEFKGILVERQRTLCFRCHPSVAVLDSMAVQHQPFLNDNCTGCHEPHGSDYIPLLDAPQPKLCYKCHPAIENQFAAESHHPIGVTLKCASCHDPHAAQYAGLLNARNNAFCYQCHGVIRAKYDDSGHKRKLCIDCHTPHGSSYAPILRNSNPNLCLQCHPPSGFDESSKTVRRNNHPVRPSNFDVNAEKPLTCTTSCHNPHGTEYTRMLRYYNAGYDGNCLMCHAVTPGNRVGIDF